MQSKSGVLDNLFSRKRPGCRPLPAAGLLSAILLFFACLGCGSHVPVTQLSGRPYQGIVLKIAQPGGAVAQMLSRYGALWASENGARLEMLAYDPKTGLDEGCGADVWIMQPARMPHWAAQGKLHEVPGTYTQEGSNYEWRDLIPDYRQKLLVWNRRVVALPVLGDALLCYYRADLFQNPEHRIQFKKQFGSELVAPATWDDYLLAAQYFNNRPRPGLERPCPSLPPLPELDDDLDQEFFAVAAPCVRRAVGEDVTGAMQGEDYFSFHYDIAAGAPCIASAGFVYSLEFYKKLQAYRPTGFAAAPAATFEKGETVLCLAGPEWIARFQANPLLRGKYGICATPGSHRIFDVHSSKQQIASEVNRVPYLGAKSWIGVVPRTSTQSKAAFAFLAAVSDPKISRETVIEPTWGGGVFRREHLESRTGWQAFGLEPSQTAEFLTALRETVMHTRIKNPVLRLRIPNERDHQRILLAEIRAVLTGGKEPARALQDTAKGWTTLDSRSDAKTRLAEYRISLNLTPDG